MASSEHVVYTAPDGTKFHFCLMFYMWKESNGVVVLPDVDVDHPDFVHALKAAQRVYPYYEALQLITEYGDCIIHGETGFDEQEQAADWIEEGIEKGILKDVPESRLQLARDIRAGIRRKRVYPEDENKVKSHPGYVYLLKAENGYYKIGRTKSPKDRIKTFGVKLPFKVEFEHLIQTDDMEGLEAELHFTFADKRLDGEWFNLTSGDVEYIKAMGEVES